MSDAGEQALAFLRALERLPPYTGIVFHGLPAVPDVRSPRWTRGLIATSTDARIATENFAVRGIVAIVSRTGRDIAAFSAHPDEHEVVLPPEIVLQEVARTSVDGRPVVILEQLSEIDPNSGLPATLAELISSVEARVREAAERPAVKVTTPGKFTERLYFADAD